MIAVLTVAGIAVRVAAARGDLWLDEIWSFRLISDVRSAADIVVALPYDNNHVLNSLWLKMVGPSASPLHARMASVVFGSLLAPVAAHAFWRFGPAAAVAAAAVFALDYTFVNFGSEARGYSGMILAIVIAYDALERWLLGQRDENETASLSDRDARACPRSQKPVTSVGNASERVLTTGRSYQNLIVFTCAVLFGTFSHLTMIEPTGILCAAAIMRLIVQGEGLSKAISPIGSIILAAIVGTAPALICFLISLAPGTLHTGLITPFSPQTLAEGLGRLMAATIGSPDRPTDSMTILLLACLGCCVVWMLAVIPPSERFFPTLATLGPPAISSALSIPNQQFARFHLIVAIGFAFLALQVWARAWDKGGPRRLVALAVALAFLVGQTINIARFLSGGRGHYAEAVAFMQKNKTSTFVVLPSALAGETAAVIRWYSGEPAVTGLKPVQAETICSTRPDWLLVVHTPNDRSETDGERMISGPCERHFSYSRTFPAYGLSGFTWTLFSRAD